jgi:hypothetical protein
LPPPFSSMRSARTPVRRTAVDLRSGWSDFLVDQVERLGRRCGGRGRCSSCRRLYGCGDRRS